MRSFSAAEVSQREDHAGMQALFNRVDQRLADTITAGADDRSYLMRVGIPRLNLTAPGAVKTPRARHIPLDVPNRAPLLDTVKNRLTPRPTSAAAPPRSADGRRAFTEAIDAARRPEPRTSELTL